MKIAVCIKRVPDMEMRFSIAGDRRSLDPTGLKYEMGDFDGYALEVALQLVEKQGPQIFVGHRARSWADVYMGRDNPSG